MTKKKVHYMLQNVQSVTTFPLPPSKIPDFIGTTENAEKNGRQRKNAEINLDGLTPDPSPSGEGSGYLQDELLTLTLTLTINY